MLVKKKKIYFGYSISALREFIDTKNVRIRPYECASRRGLSKARSPTSNELGKCRETKLALHSNEWFTRSSLYTSHFIFGILSLEYFFFCLTGEMVDTFVNTSVYPAMLSVY